MANMITDGTLGLTFPDTTSMNSAAQLGMRNLLINGNFNFNQRGYVSGTATTAANQYTLDRWRVITSGQALTFATSGNGNIVTAPAGGIEQIIEGASIGIASGVINWVGTATCTVDGNAKTKGQTVTLTPGTNSSVKFFGGTVSLAQQEAGAVPSPFEYRAMNVELAMCMRYFQLVRNAVGIVGTSTSVYRLNSKFTTPMRTAPSVTLNGTVNLQLGNQSGSISSIGVTYATFEALECDANIVSTTATIGSAVVAMTGSTGSIACSAEF